MRIKNGVSIDCECQIWSSQKLAEQPFADTNILEKMQSIIFPFEYLLLKKKQTEFYATVDGYDSAELEFFIDHPLTCWRL